MPANVILRQQIIALGMLDDDDGGNINGPACIEVPPRVAGRLGRYYLYFAHHRGDHIRLAFADRTEGPWKIRRGGVLHLSQLPQCRDHIASPDVVIDPDSGEFRMYFHGVDAATGLQQTYVARSVDGMHFMAAPGPVAPFYLRVVHWRDVWIGMSKGGLISLSSDGTRAFRPLPTPAFPMSGPHADAPGDIRHVALELDGDRLWVLFSRIGDAPEHVRLGYIDLLRPMGEWKVEASVPLLLPEREWEGASLPLAPSRAGMATTAENALRDPAILRTEDALWLFYSIAGEQGIAVALLPDLAKVYLDSPKVPHWPPRVPDRADAPTMADQIRLLSQPGALERRLAELDGWRPKRRIYLMGCGRSGTWLLTALMSCFGDTAVVAKELPVEAFGLIETVHPTIVLKRSFDAHSRMGAIPGGIGLIFIVRHPFDVLTSHNPMEQRKYYISPERWVSEMGALRHALDGGRSKVLILMYEELVRDPQAALTRIGATFELSQARDVATTMDAVRLPNEAVTAMHGVRPIDQYSVGRYQKNKESLDYLGSIVAQLGDLLPWMAEKFGYDVSL